MSSLTSKLCRLSKSSSLTLKLMMFIGLSTIIVLLGFGLYIERNVKDHFVQQDMDELQSTAHSIQNSMLETPNLELMWKHIRLIMSTHPSVFTYLENAQGQMIYFSEESDTELLKFIMENKQSYVVSDQSLQVWENKTTNYRVLIKQIETNKQPVNMVIGVNIDFHQHYLQDFRKSLWIAALVAYLFMISVSWIVVRYSLKPLRKISSKIHNITSEHLNTRLKVETVPVELQELVRSFNNMIGNIEEVFERQSYFSADIAHELRTPITNLTAQTQILLNKSRTVEEYQDILYSNLEEFERLSKMVNDMLFLATSERETTLNNETINLEKEIDALIEYFELLAEDEGIALSITGQASNITGDRLMIQRALSNLLSNAINYASKNTEVRIVLSQVDNKSVIKIINAVDNPLQPEQLERLFYRFYRVDPARQRKSGGSGIGLAIVKSIIDAHKASVLAEYDNGFVTITMVFSL